MAEMRDHWQIVTDNLATQITDLSTKVGTLTDTLQGFIKTVGENNGKIESQQKILIPFIATFILAILGAGAWAAYSNAALSNTVGKIDERTKSLDELNIRVGKLEQGVAAIPASARVSVNSLTTSLVSSKEKRSITPVSRSICSPSRSSTPRWSSTTKEWRITVSAFTFRTE